MSEGENGLPTGWAAAQVGSVCTLVNGRAFKPAEWSEVGLPIVRIQNLNDPTKPFNRFAGQVEERYYIDSGELLFAWSGTPGTSFGAHVWSGGRAILNQHIFRVLFPEDLLNKEFLRLAINERLTHLIQIAHGGVGLRHVTKPVFEGTELRLAPLNEQKRIVAKLDALQARSDAAKEALDAIPPLLEKFRQSVLASAFRGDLTKKWREAHPEVEPATELLKRIRAERRRKWEEANPKKKYVEPEPVDADGLPELPEGWCWASLDEIAEIKGGLTKGKQRRPEDELQEVPYLRVANVQRGHLDLKEVKTIIATSDEINDLRLRAGDVLFNEGGDRDKLGRGWVWNNEVDLCIHQNHVFRARLVGSSVVPEFISHYGNSEAAKLYFLRSGKQTTNLASINMTQLKALPLPLAPHDEQKELSQLIGAAFMGADASGQATGATCERLATLNQSVLAKAFRGELVPQDPNDEPATALLERIRQEREAQGGSGTAGRRGRQPRTASPGGR